MLCFHTKIPTGFEMPLDCRVESGDAHWRFYRLPLVTGGAEPQEGGVIAREWTYICRYILVYQCPNEGVRASMVATGGRFVKMLRFFVDKLLISFPHKKNTINKFKKPPNIHKNAKLL